MDIKAILAKLKAGEDLTPEEIAALDAVHLGVSAEDVARMTADAVQAAVEPLLAAQRNLNPNAPAAGQSTFKPRVNGYSDLLREITNMRRQGDFDAAVIKALSEGTTTEGGYLVQPEYAAEVLRFVGEYGVLRKYAAVIPTRAMSIKISTRDSGMTAYWNAEAVAATQSKPVYSQVTLAQSKLSVLSDPISRELIADAFVDMIQEVGIEAVEAMEYAEDYAGFSGDGTSTYGSFTGILKATGTGSKSLTGTIDQLDYDFVNGMIHAIAAPRRMGAAFFTNRTVLEIIRGVKDLQGRPLFIESTTPAQPSTLFGYPIIESEAMPTSTTVGSGEGFMVFGNLRNCVRIYDRQELIVDVTAQGYVNSVDLFSTDQVVVKHMRREAIIVARPAGLVVGKLA